MGGRGRSGGGRRERKRTEFAGEGVERGGGVLKEAWIRALGDRTFFKCLQITWKWQISLMNCGQLITPVDAVTPISSL